VVAGKALPQSVLREATDKRLLDAVVDAGAVTRAELAASTGFSKPTVSEAVRRLVEAGLLDATGLQETGRRGRVGTFYELGASAGWVLAIEVDQSGIQAHRADLAGRVLDQLEQPPGAPGDAEALVEGLRSVVRQATAAGAGQGPLRAVAVSVANPVHPLTHQVIPLPASPFPEGLLNPAEVLADLVAAPVLVDNDVNLAALAEHRVGAATGAASFGYVYVGAGLGLGLYIGDQLIRGSHGLAGEIGYLPGVPGASGPRTLAAELAASGFGRPDAPSNDVGGVLRLLDRCSAEDGGDAASRQALRVLSDAVARAVASVNAVVDPELVLLGGPVGSHPALLPPVSEALNALGAGPTRLAHGTLGRLAPLHGATQLALDHARAAAISTSAGKNPRPERYSPPGALLVRPKRPHP
jgi:predicted NBD/HSP70 family sugar kinase